MPSRLGKWIGSPLAIIFLLAVLVRTVYLVQFMDSPLVDWDKWEQSDMHTFLSGAGQILSGDWWGKEPYIPYHTWHERIAPVEQWRRWHPPHSFHQVPGYYYVLAVLLKLSMGSLAVVKTIHAILGAAHATILAALGRKLMGTAGGLTVGILAALYGPFIAMEGLILRESLALFLATLGVFLTVGALARSGASNRESAWMAWTAAGIIMGFAAITKETGFILFAGTLFWVLASTLRRGTASERSSGMFLLFGFLASLSILIVRNLAVGAPPLPTSPPAVFNFIIANAADSPSQGILFVTPPSFRSIMEQSNGRLLPAMVATLHTYDDHPSRIVAHLWSKFTAIWSNIEMPDDFSYEYFAMRLPILAVLPRFVCIWVPAALGLILLVAGRKRLSPLQRQAFGLVLTILLLHVLAQTFAPVMSRYRVVIVPYLMLLAAWPMAMAATWWTARRWSSVAALLGGLLIASLGWSAWPDRAILSGSALRPLDFALGAQLERNSDAARREYDRGIDQFRSRNDVSGQLLLRADRILYFTSRGQGDEVRDDWDVLHQVLPENHPLRLYLRQRLSAQQGIIDTRSRRP